MTTSQHATAIRSLSHKANDLMQKSEIPTWGDIVKIENIRIENGGHIFCRSEFYSVLDVLPDNVTYEFSNGINVLLDDIDSGNWAVSYLLSMYRYEAHKTPLFSPMNAIVNNDIIPLTQLWEYTCYMDRIFPLFRSRRTVSHLISQGIKMNGISTSAEYIRELFHIDRERYCRPLKNTGNEIYKVMAAIGYVYGKQVFCFPWFSRRRYNAFHDHMSEALNVLNTLGKIVILPLEKE